MADLSKGPLQLGEQRTLCAALEDFHDKATAGFEDIHRHGERRLGQRDDPQVIGRSMAGCRRRHVAQHDIGQITKIVAPATAAVSAISTPKTLPRPDPAPTRATAT